MEYITDVAHDGSTVMQCWHSNFCVYLNALIEQSNIELSKSSHHFDVAILRVMYEMCMMLCLLLPCAGVALKNTGHRHNVLYACAQI